jgi:ankyrin repeat protein
MRFESNGTPLGFAVDRGNLALTETLLKHGAQVNTRGPNGYTALRSAILHASAPLVDLLLTNGAAVDLKDEEGVTDIGACLESRQPASPQSGIYSVPPPGVFPNSPGQMLRSSERGRSSLSDAKRHILNALLAHGADVSTPCPYSLPLVQAVRLGDTNVVETLLANRANVNLIAPSGESPLLEAVRLGDLPVTAILLSKGADVNLKGGHGFTALHVAAAAGQTNMMEILCDKKAEPNIPDDLGYAPLHYAAFNGLKPVVQFLLAHGAKVNVVAHNGLTPAQVASEGTSSQGPRIYGSIPELVRNAQGAPRRRLSESEREIKELLQNESSKAEN